MTGAVPVPADFSAAITVMQISDQLAVPVMGAPLGPATAEEGLIQRGRKNSAVNPRPAACPRAATDLYRSLSVVTASITQSTRSP